ncbi:hypothetical protein AGLY_009821 [Aphis glycines]|uniref:Uncharacterized protein n=1 Tax=Aphis glycines TaxID=307491 RepID=A0A6G0TH41_APHGL|nr:hypothetical protein AGLY_009821 [Aphis glycines]
MVKLMKVLCDVYYCLLWLVQSSSIRVVSDNKLNIFGASKDLLVSIQVCEIIQNVTSGNRECFKNYCVKHFKHSKTNLSNFEVKSSNFKDVCCVYHHMTLLRNGHCTVLRKAGIDSKVNSSSLCLESKTVVCMLHKSNYKILELISSRSKYPKSVSVVDEFTRPARLIGWRVSRNR